jgi:hypothetical protein
MNLPIHSFVLPPDLSSRSEGAPPPPNVPDNCGVLAEEATAAATATARLGTE